jgi:hypothetical protein
MRPLILPQLVPSTGNPSAGNPSTFNAVREALSFLDD